MKKIVQSLTLYPGVSDVINKQSRPGFHLFIHPLIVPQRIQDGKEGFSITHPPGWQELQRMCNEAWPLCPGNVWTVGCELQNPNFGQPR